MKALKSFFISAALALGLVGCATPAASPQEAINQANLLITAITQQIGENYDNKVLTRDEALAYQAKVKAFVADVNEAQRLLDDGQDVLAGDKARIVERLLISLQREIAQKAREVPK